MAGASIGLKKKQTPLQQGMSYYAGKTITIIAPDNVGGGNDQVARAIAPAIGSFLSATVDVENDPPAVTIAGQDAANAATPNGLTIGMFDVGVDQEDSILGLPGVNFNPERLAWLGGQGAGGGAILVCTSSSPFHSFRDVVGATAASPVSEVSISTGTQTLDTQLLNAAFGIHYKLINGYTSTALATAGWARGDGACEAEGLNETGTYVNAGKAAIMLQSNIAVNPATAYSSLLNGIPTFAQEEKAFPAKTKEETLARTAYSELTGIGSGHTFFLQTKVPDDEVVAMRAAIYSAFHSPQIENNLLKTGQSNNYVNGPKAKAGYLTEGTALRHVKTLLASTL